VGDLAARLVHCRQRHRHERREPHVVEPDHPHLPRHAHAVPSQRPDQHRRRLVVGARHRRIGLEWIGWAATAIFGASYFCKRAADLRRVQAMAAPLWIAYGLMIRAAPVVAANLVVASLAIYSARARRPSSSQESGGRGDVAAARGGLARVTAVLEVP
jgi:hypothetical protein